MRVSKKSFKENTIFFSVIKHSSTCLSSFILPFDSYEERRLYLKWNCIAMHRITSMVSIHLVGMLQIKRSNKSFKCHLIIYSFHFIHFPSSSSFHSSSRNSLSNLYELKNVQHCVIQWLWTVCM